MSLLRFLLFSIYVASISASSPPSVYEVLESYGFPVGLLPTGVTIYTLDPAAGKFSVNLNASCSFNIQGYDLKYKTSITGSISKGKISNLNGIQVKFLLFWVNIIEVSMDGDNLELSVGIASADFPVDNFYECPQCGCGFDCVNRRTSSGKFSFRKLFPLLEA